MEPHSFTLHRQEKAQDKQNVPKHIDEPDRELLVWEKWIKIRRDETTKLAKTLNKQPVDLAMNLLDKVRPDIERKTALVNAQIEEKTEVRGSTWDRPPRLKQPCDYCCPAYELTRTRAEMGNPRIIEHVGIPTYIKQEELGMAGEPHRVSCYKMDADYFKYREKREEELTENIYKIDPFRPYFADLLVRGKRPPPSPPKMPPVPEITIHIATNVPEEPLSGVYAMKINDTVFYKDIPGQDLVHLRKYQEENSEHKCTSWTYYFNVPVKKAGRSKLLLQNIGTVAMRYCWKKIRRIIPFIPDDQHEQVFFFNKNEDVISPGQSKEVFFTFMSENPGIYTESWELSMCNMSFFDTLRDKLAINLYADSVENMDKLKRKVEILKTRINRKSIHNIAVEFLNEIFDKIFIIPRQIYPYKHYFLESEMFVMKNPVCFYHQTEVAKMKERYTEMVPRGEWDLSISSWRLVMMRKDFDDRMKYYEMLRHSHSDLLKPWYEGQELSKEKHLVVNCLLGQLFDQFDKEDISIKEVLSEKSESAAPTIPAAPTITSASAMRIKSKSKSIIILDSFNAHMARMIFYIRIQEHVANTLETCAGVLSSMDLKRWIDFDFCRKY